MKRLQLARTTQPVPGFQRISIGQKENLSYTAYSRLEKPASLIIVRS